MPASEYTRCSFFPPTLKQGRKEGTGGDEEREEREEKQRRRAWQRIVVKSPLGMPETHVRVPRVRLGYCISDPVFL